MLIVNPEHGWLLDEIQYKKIVILVKIDEVFFFWNIKDIDDVI
jgi:hypothetical protein